MSSLAVLAIYAQQLDGWAEPLGQISSPTEYKVKMNSADNVVYATVNGGAWTPIIGSGGLVVTVTLQQAYDGGGAVGSGTGRSISSMTGAVVMKGSGANNNNILELSKTPAGAQTGSALAIDMGVNAVFGPGINMSVAQAACVGVRVSTLGSTAFDVVASGPGSGFAMQRAYTGAGAGAAMLSLSDQTPGIGAGAHDSPAVKVLFAPQFNANASLASDPCSITSSPLSSGGATTLTLDKSVFSITHAPTNLGGGAITDTSIGFTVSMSPLSAASAVVGVSVSMSANSSGPAITCAVAGTGNGVTVTKTADASGGNLFAGVDQASAASGARSDRMLVLSEVSTFTASGSFSTPRAQITHSPASSGGATTLTLNQPILSLVHLPGVAAGGAITDTTVGLSVSMSPQAASVVVGASLTLSSLSRGQGLLVTHNGSTAAAGSVAARLTGANQSVCLEMTDGRNVGVSAADEGRIRYNSNTQRFEQSSNGVAFAAFGVSSLQAAYDGGNTIALAGGNPVSLTNNAGANYTIQTHDANGAALAALYTLRDPNAGNGAVWSGNALLVSNAPTASGTNITESGVLVQISHAPLSLAGGTIADTTTGQAITMTPAAAASVVKGLVVTMGANASGVGAFAADLTVNAANRGPVAPLRMNGVQFFVNAGAPNNADGANGDIYYRNDGAAAAVATQSVIYFKAAGAWAPVA